MLGQEWCGKLFPPSLYAAAAGRAAWAQCWPVCLLECVCKRDHQKKNSATYDQASYVDDANDRAIYYISLRFSLLVPLRWIYSRKWYGAHKRFLRYTQTHAQTNTEHTVSKSKQRIQYTPILWFVFLLFRWFLFIIAASFFLVRVFHSELCFCAIWITHIQTNTWKEKRKEKQTKKKERKN